MRRKAKGVVKEGTECMKRSKRKVVEGTRSKKRIKERGKVRINEGEGR